MFVALLAWGLVGHAQPTMARQDSAGETQPTRSVAIGEIQFTIPANTELQLVAQQPLIRWPVAAVWDNDRSLLVLESNWNQQTVVEQLESKPHRIVRLVDQDGDGRFDSRKLVADNLSFSAGLLMHGGDLFVSSPPAILKLQDRDRDGFFEHREIWHDGGTITYCANDLHGPFLGPDGWIYWTKGAFAEQTIELAGGRKIRSKAAHLFRRRPTGGPVDVLMTGGMDNPVDVAFLDDGQQLFCSTFMHQPGDGLRDGIGHAIYGSLFGKLHDVVEGHPRTGPLLDPIIELGPAAPASVARLVDEDWWMVGNPAAVAAERGLDSNQAMQTIVGTEFNFQKVALHRIEPRSATFTASSRDLLVADRVDFHPVDVLEDHDGSLIILDTGGWYDLCCPSSGTPGQIAPGGIYRLTRIAGSSKQPTDTPAAEAPAAEAEFAERGEPADSDPTSSASRLAQFWDRAAQLVEQPHPKSTNGDPSRSDPEINDAATAAIRAMVIKALSDDDPALRRSALHVVSLYRWDEARGRLIEMLRSPSPHIVRLSAEALGRFGNADADTVAALMSVADRAPEDRSLRHAIVLALINLDAGAQVRSLRDHPSTGQRWTAMLVLAELDQLASDDVGFLFQSLREPNPQFRDDAVAILAAKPDLAIDAQSHLEALWHSIDGAMQDRLGAIAVAWRGETNMESVVGGFFQRWDSAGESQRRALITLLRGQQGRSLPSPWLAPLVKIVDGGDGPSDSIANALAGINWTLPQDQPLLDAIIRRVNDRDAAFEKRLQWLESVPDQTEGISRELRDRVLTQLRDREDSDFERSIAAVPKFTWDTSGAEQIIGILPSLGPVQMQSVVEGLLAADNAEIDRLLLRAIPKLATAGSLDNSGTLAAVADRPAEVREQWESKLESLRGDDSSETTLDDWLRDLPAGDPAEGYQVFRSAKAACAACHQIGYVGGRIGPELSRIGRSRSRRDLLEAILFPSHRIEPSYRTTQVLTVDGRLINGLLVSKTADEIELVTGVDKRVIIAVDEIATRRPSDQSIMPNGLDKVLTRQQMADLIQFLQSNR
jgi:putative heme-binding domain-containing protein